MTKRNPEYSRQGAAWPGVFFGFASIILFQAYLGFLHFNELYPSALPFALVCVIAICAASSFITYSGIPGYLATLMRGLAIGCALYNVLQFPLIPAIQNDFGGLAQPLLAAAWAVAGTGAVIALWRPSWLLLCGFYPYWLKCVAAHLTGFQYKPLEILPLYQLPAYAGITLVALQLLFLSRKNALERASRALQTSSVDPYKTILIVAIAMQSANYFYSGIAKGALGDGLLDWAMSNETQNIFFVALYNKQLVWGDWREMVAAASGLFASAARPLAMAIFLSQLCAILVFTNRRLLLLLFAFFDAMHFGIFALVGANFATWFLVNLAIIAAVGKLPERALDWKTGASGALLIAAATLYADVERLAWYDTLAVNSAYFEVVHEGGKRTRVPRTAFGFYSHPIANMSLGLPPGDYVPTGTNGGTLSSTVHEQAQRCDFDTHNSAFEARWDENAVSSLIKGYHRQILERVGGDGRWSNALSLNRFATAPSVVQEFAGVDMRQVSAYVLIIDSVCLKPGSGELAQKVHYNEFRIDVNK